MLDIHFNIVEMMTLGKESISGAIHHHGKIFFAGWDKTLWEYELESKEIKELFIFERFVQKLLKF